MSVEEDIRSRPAGSHAESFQLRDITEACFASRGDDAIGRTGTNAGNLEQGSARCTVDLDWLDEVALGPGLLGRLVAWQQPMFVEWQIGKREAVVTDHEVRLIEPQRARRVFGARIRTSGERSIGWNAEK